MMTDFLIRFAFTSLVLVLFAGYLAFRMSRKLRLRAVASEQAHAERLADFDRKAAEWHAEQDRAEAEWAAQYAELLRDVGHPADDRAPASDSRS